MKKKKFSLPKKKMRKNMANIIINLVQIAISYINKIERDSWTQFVGFCFLSFLFHVYLLVCRYGLLSRRSWYSIHFGWRFGDTYKIKALLNGLCTMNGNISYSTHHLAYIRGQNNGRSFQWPFSSLDHCSSRCFAMAITIWLHFLLVFSVCLCHFRLFAQFEREPNEWKSNGQVATDATSFRCIVD